MNQYLADTKLIAAGATEDFIFTLDTDGFILVAVDGKVDDTPFHQLATCPYIVKGVTRRGAGKDADSNMGNGDIPLDLFCRMGSDRQKLFYEEPLKGASKVKISVQNGDQDDHHITIVVWGATPPQDPYYVRPEDWPKLTPWKVAEFDRGTKDE
jgi:hypothetical protein